MMNFSTIISCTSLCLLVHNFVLVFGGQKGSNIVLHGSGKHNTGSVIVNSQKKSQNIVIRDHRGTVVLNNNDKKGASNIVINQHHEEHHKPDHHHHHMEKSHKIMPMKGEGDEMETKSSPSHIKPYGSSEDEQNDYNDNHDDSPNYNNDNSQSYNNDTPDEIRPIAYGREEVDTGYEGYQDGPGPLPQSHRKGLRELEEGVEFGVEDQVEEAVERQIERGNLAGLVGSGGGDVDDGSSRPVGHSEESLFNGYLGTADEDTFGSSLEAPPSFLTSSQPYFSEPDYHFENDNHREEGQTYSDSIDKRVWSIPKPIAKAFNNN